MKITRTETNMYCTLHNPQQEHFIEIKLRSNVYGVLYAAILYVAQLFENDSKVTDSVDVHTVQNI